MILALSGTPGTGKSSVGGYIREHHGREYLVLDLNKLILEEDLVSGWDEVRGTYEADLDKVEARVKELITSEKRTVILQGHLSHYLKGDASIVLRTAPQELEKRLRERGYRSAKIRENVEAEALDVILVEAWEAWERVYEIDTTGKTVPIVAEEVLEVIENIKQGRGEELIPYKPGRIDWSRYFEALG
jgi:adenylate kinase